MAGLEVVVRPVVFPNIRPAPPRVLPPLDDPTKGFATITGSGGGLIDMPHSFSASTSKPPEHKETKRTYDVDRVFQKKGDDDINPKNYIDVERLKRVGTSNRGDAPQIRIKFADPPERDNVETIETDKTREAT